MALYKKDPAQVTKRLPPSSYKVAWICALSLEMSAARVMLDEEHLPVNTAPGDDNVYLLGSICGHNLAITCLPEGIYGTTSAALVARDMCSTFPSITMPLLVGIGGGVPQPEFDIRLGDVVVSAPSSAYPAIIQYDYGKTEAEGVLIPKGTSNKPASSLLRAVASFKSNHKEHSKRMLLSITNAIGRFQLANKPFARPDVRSDTLFEPGCEHVAEDVVCTDCGPVKPIPRDTRESQGPLVFYGTIASGNQVIKHARTRDRIALEEGRRILCFEMEAAGVIDVLPCLVIRGISDYCDTHKHKEFQQYAALTAAAYAKELLAVIPIQQQLLGGPLVQESDRQEHRRNVLQAIKVEVAENHKATVKRAHPATCAWLADQAEYIQWRELEDVSQHHGIFWLKGKPGVGKSVLMKYLYQQIEHRQNAKTISFFYNARGHQSESSTSGMYRSLIYQLIGMFPDLQNLLDEVPLLKDRDCYSLELLQAVFKQLVERLGQIDLFCFIDALDECANEDQIRDMLDIFEDLGEGTCSGQLRFRVCFSSRHYPNISLRNSTQINLELQVGHVDDIRKYLDMELKLGASERFVDLKNEVLQRSGGVFLWVVLAVRLLKKKLDRGQVQVKSMLETLSDIPSNLDTLFLDMLRRDEDDVFELQLCMRWVLHAIKPLKRKELYYALLTGCAPHEVGPWDPQDITEADMDRYILNCSKGLIELTHAREPTVQFIHESVREFLLKPDALVDLWPDFQGFHRKHSLDLLKDLCYSYIITVADSATEMALKCARLRNGSSSIRRLIDTTFPFLEHSARHVLSYAQEASLSGLTQIWFLQTFDTRRWISVWNATQKWQADFFSLESDICSVLQKLDRRHLIEYYPEKLLLCADHLEETSNQGSLNDQGRQYESDGQDLQHKHARSTSNRRILSVLACGYGLEAFQTVRAKRASGFQEDRKEPSYSEEYLDFKEFLDTMVGPFPSIHTLEDTSKWCKDMVRLRLDFDAQEDSTSKGIYRWSSIRQLIGRAAHDRVAFAGFLSLIARYLYGVRHDAEQACFEAVSEFCSKLEHPATPILLKALLVKDWNLQQDLIDRAMSHAIEHWYEKSILLLLERGANNNTVDAAGKTALHAAAIYGCVHIATNLISDGARVNARDKNGYTPLMYLSISGRNLRPEAIIIGKALLNHGASINTVTPGNDTALSLAVRSSVTELALLLIQHGIRGLRGETALQHAVASGQFDVVQAILAMGGNIETSYSYKPPRVGEELFFDGSLLHLATFHSQIPIIRSLLDAGISIDSRNSMDETSLHVAVRYATLEAVKCLLDRGANPNVCNRDKITPLQMAMKRGEKDIILLLFVKGARRGNFHHSSRPLAVWLDDFVIDTKSVV